jgi:predicted nucleic acid-binding protein
VFFLESSALVKLFVAEKGSDRMIHLAETSEDAMKLASSLAQIEVRSAIRRRQRGGDITESDAADALRQLELEWRRLIEHPLTSSVVSHALAIVDRQFLRSLDAVQLATAIAAQASLPPGRQITFVCVDERLLKAAQAEGLKTLNPELG